MRKGLILAGVGTLIGVLIVAPVSQPSGSFLLRVALAVTCLLAVVMTPVSAQRWHTLALWASIGVTMGFGLGGLFGIGPVGLVPFVLVIAYAVLTRRELDYGLNLTGGAVSAMLLVVMTVPIQPFT